MAQGNLSEEERRAIREHIERLREEHRDLDAAIEALTLSGAADRLQLQRLKKRKLALRDRMQRLGDESDARYYRVSAISAASIGVVASASAPAAMSSSRVP